MTIEEWVELVEFLGVSAAEEELSREEPGD